LKDSNTIGWKKLQGIHGLAAPENIEHSTLNNQHPMTQLTG
jgi:hypothetical protein